MSAPTEITTRPEFDPIEVRRTLVLSTCHIPLELARAFNQHNTDDAYEEDEALIAEIFWERREGGWMLLINEDVEIQKALPQEIQAIFALAEQHDCTWVCLDQDGPRVKDLPCWEW